MKATYFESGNELRAWLKAHHDRATELLVGLYKKGARRTVMTYQDALDAALAYGWIDGVRRTVDADRWTIRFTPRRARSIWSNVNIKRMNELIPAGRIEPPGRRAFDAREAKRSGVYLYEQRHSISFDAASARLLAAGKKAKTFFHAQPPGYKRLITVWVMSAKKEATRQSRLARLIAASAQQQRIDFMKPRSK